MNNEINNTSVTKRTERLKLHVRNFIKKARLSQTKRHKSNLFVVKPNLLQVVNDPKYRPRLEKAKSLQEVESVLADFVMNGKRSRKSVRKGVYRNE